MATKRLQQLIERTNLRLVDECEGQYLTGFESWEEIEKFCDQFNAQHEDGNADAVILHKRNGSKWKYARSAWGAFLADSSDICESLDAVSAYVKTDFDNKEQFLHEEYYPLIDGLDEDDDAEEIAYYKRIADEQWEAFQKMKDNHALVIFDGGDYGIEETNCLRYSTDVHNYMIAVEVTYHEADNPQIIIDAIEENGGLMFDAVIDAYKESTGLVPSDNYDKFICFVAEYLHDHEDWWFESFGDKFPLEDYYRVAKHYFPEH